MIHRTCQGTVKFLRVARLSLMHWVLEKVQAVRCHHENAQLRNRDRFLVLITFLVVFFALQRLIMKAGVGIRSLS